MTPSHSLPFPTGQVDFSTSSLPTLLSFFVYSPLSLIKVSYPGVGRVLFAEAKANYS